ncbi:MAG: L-rhamnose mutarotase [Terracidiphilus sp.]|nr:L-rhamnose mutarotase [Terracidiphilus sp.]MDR3798875.1 L-rhamnose mutarotase [Terracidiphilus sp.]
MNTYCFALDLNDDPQLIEEYKRWHQLENIWPEVLECIRAKGVLSQKIYLASNRLVLILETTDDFDLDAKAAADRASPQMRKWEELMWKFQKPLPHARPGEKWVRMEKIFEVT